MAPTLTGKDLLAGAKKLSTSGLASFTRAQKKALLENPVTRRALYNPNATFTASQVKGALQKLQSQPADSGVQFSQQKSAGAITEHMQEQQVVAETRDEKKVDAVDKDAKREENDWEVRLREKREQAERMVLEQRAAGREEAALRRVVAKRGQMYARAQTIQELKEERKREDQQRIAKQDPKQLAKQAIDLAI